MSIERKIRDSFGRAREEGYAINGAVKFAAEVNGVNVIFALYAVGLHRTQVRS